MRFFSKTTRPEKELRGERQFPFLVPLWDTLFKGRVVQLKETHRQAGDREYWKLLQRMRVGRMTAADHQKMASRVRTRTCVCLCN